jgi:hypothetical protein
MLDRGIVSRAWHCEALPSGEELLIPTSAEQLQTCRKCKLQWHKWTCEP